MRDRYHTLADRKVVYEALKKDIDKLIEADSISDDVAYCALVSSIQSQLHVVSYNTCHKNK